MTLPMMGARTRPSTAENTVTDRRMSLGENRS
jgi:hypothetical protein